MPETWEYLTLPAIEASEDHLNGLGREGWELVGTGQGSDGPALFLKRPGLSFRERVTLDQKRRYYALWGLPTSEETPRPKRGQAL